MIAVQGVSKFMGKKELFTEVSFHIRPGERIGLIGTNGSGKTTLFHILLGETEPDDGTVMKAKSLRLGYLPQQWMPIEGKAVLAHAMDVAEEVHAIHSELLNLQRSLDTEKNPERSGELALHQTHLLEQLEHLGGYDLEARALKILAGLGFRHEQLDRLVSTLSGGWVMRLELARLLLSEPDLLLLDEPTNHLDLESLLWLENYLVNSSSAMVIISHDREFLNRLVSRILELDHGQLHGYSGNYDNYLEEKPRRKEIHYASYKNQQERIRQIERFVERNRYRKDRARQVQSRLKLLDKIDRIEITHDQGEIHFAFPEPLRPGRRVLELRQVSKAYGEHTVYTGIDLVVERGDRIALLGANGAGKSTLLKILAGVESISSGERLPGHQVITGYYAQYQLEQLKPEWTVLEEASSVAGDMAQSHLRGLLGAFLFQGDDVTKRVAVLSGGEKARLMLCKLLLQRPNVLLLDEPTNHLDIPSQDVLEKALEAFPGTVCFISHDRHFINRIASKVLEVRSGHIHLFPGNYNDYRDVWLKRLEEEDLSAPPVGQKSVRSESPDEPSAKRAQAKKKLEADWRNEFYRLKKPLQERLDNLETLLHETQLAIETLNQRLADPATYQNGNVIQDLQKEYQQTQQKILLLTRDWEESALALEELEEGFWKDKGRQQERANGERLAEYSQP